MLKYNYHQIMKVGYFLAALLLSVSIFSAEPVFINENFDKISPIVWKGKRISQQNGQLTLTAPSSKKYKSGWGVFKQSFIFPKQTEHFLSISMEIVAMKEAAGKDFSSSARIFITPEPPSKYLEPYILKDVLWFCLEKNPDNSYSFSLYKKVNVGKPGRGELLFQAAVKQQDFPFKFTLLVNSQSYRLLFNKELETSRGARSGYIKFSDNWDDDLYFGIRIVNHLDGINAQLTIDNLLIKEKK